MASLKIQLRLCGGYCGEHGFLVAWKTISVPFMPFNGLELTVDGVTMYVQHGEDTGNDFAIGWDDSKKLASCYVGDLGDWEFKTASNLQHVVYWFESRGWLVEDIDPGAKHE